jgi:hypothetical protein
MRETCGIEKVYVACRILGAETYSAPKEEEAKARATSQAFQVVFESLGHAMWLTICQKKGSRPRHGHGNQSTFSPVPANEATRSSPWMAKALGTLRWPWDFEFLDLDLDLDLNRC